MPSRKQRGSDPAVLINVSGGVAEFSATHGVQVVVVDWDNLKSPSAHQDYTSENIQTQIDELRTLPSSIVSQDTLRELERIRDQIRKVRTEAGLPD